PSLHPFPTRRSSDLFCLSSAPAAVGLKALKADLAALKPPSAICPVPMGAQPLRKPKVASPRMIKGRLGKLFVFTLHLLRLLSAHFSTAAIGVPYREAVCQLPSATQRPAMPTRRTVAHPSRST